MRNFKSLTASVLAAVAALGFVTLSAPAQACFACTGMKLNGVQFNGPILQGPVIQGPVIQGPVIQGPVIQGPILQGVVLNGQTTTGTQAGQYVAVTLPSGETVSLR